MDAKQKALKELIVFLEEQFFERNFFVCVYGSYISNHYSETSDMDIFIAVEKQNADDFDKVVNYFIILCARNNLKLDDEVPHKNKLIVSYDDVHQALLLRSFVKNGFRYHVPPIVKSKEFLASPEIRWRLILNALTSPHECVCGDTQKYNIFKTNAEKAIMQLAYGLTEAMSPTHSEILTVLFLGPNGEGGEMYLGYKKEREQTVRYLSELILRNRYDTIQ